MSPAFADCRSAGAVGFRLLLRPPPGRRDGRRAQPVPSLPAGLLRCLCGALVRHPGALHLRDMADYPALGHGKRRDRGAAGRAAQSRTGPDVAPPQRHPERRGRRYPGGTGGARGGGGGGPSQSAERHRQRRARGRRPRARGCRARCRPEPPRADAQGAERGREDRRHPAHRVFVDRDPDDHRHRALAGVRVDPVLRQDPLLRLRARHRMEPADRAAGRSGRRDRGVRRDPALRGNHADHRDRDADRGPRGPAVGDLSLGLRGFACSSGRQAGAGNSCRHPRPSFTDSSPP